MQPKNDCLVVPQQGKVIRTAPQGCMALLQVLEERMEYYSNDEKADTINRVRGGISEVKNVMIENIDKVRFYGTLLVCG